MAAIFARNARSGTVRRGRGRATQLGPPPLPPPTPTAAEMMRSIGMGPAAPATPGPQARPVESVGELESIWDYEDVVDAALEDLMRSRKRS